MRIMLLLSFCAFAISGAYAETAAVQKATPDRGRIYFYRASSIVGIAIQPEVRLNGQKVGTATSGGFFVVDRPKGRYEASTTTEAESKFGFTLAPGERKYIRMSISPGILAGRINFEVVSRAVAEAELPSLSQTARPASR
jgi:Protein of unknown function (DUF2846)